MFGLIRRILIILFLIPFLLGSSIFAYGLGKELIGEFFFYGEIKEAKFIDITSQRAGGGHRPLYTALVELAQLDDSYRDTIRCNFQFGRDLDYYWNQHLFGNNAKLGDKIIIKTITNNSGRIIQWKDLEIKNRKFGSLGKILAVFGLTILALFVAKQIYSFAFNYPSLMNNVKPHD